MCVWQKGISIAIFHAMKLVRKAVEEEEAEAYRSLRLVGEAIYGHCSICIVRLIVAAILWPIVGGSCPHRIGHATIWFTFRDLHSCIGHRWHMQQSLD